ncbi:hypothetical protein [Streptomyces deccanensis]|uniref:hypothetical protein n=1 Tax=Streptomyces deccanensis TaxID=424188 RepID=UPI001EFB3B80|nr:hypothetical protein [Streptomyces deccanensis]ULR48461.1 hypothetical protein L3078_03775 [Streptomyces deccanensis]
MPKRLPFLSGHGLGWSTRQRVAAIGLGLAVLLAVAATVALITGRTSTSTSTSTSRAHAPSAVSGNGSPTVGPQSSAGAGAVAKPPSMADPVAFAQAAAVMLWSYDTRSTTRGQQLAGMRAWLTPEGAYADWASLAAQVPDPVLWSRMVDQDQYATATVDEAHYPTAFKQALADDPAAITEAYIYAVTVTGSQRIVWRGGGAGSEDRSVTLAVQCRPHHDCALVSLAPRVVP